ncbi:MAG TPA: 30S ribosomal protein S8 [Gemmataceae bacterium]|nr:30S ribosomal protein S8 [Gemmataceae bacterium]
MMTDPIADMLTRIRNANRIERPVVDIPATRFKAAIAQVLKDEGFILDYQVGEETTDEHGHPTFTPNERAAGPKAILRVYMKYGPEGERVIRRLERASKPGLRVYRRRDQLRPVLDGLGISIISTSRGVMSDRRARAERLGGELVCTVW